MESVKRWLIDNGCWLLVASVVVLLTTRRLYNLPLLVLALTALYLLARQWRTIIARSEMRLLLLLFALLWMPMVLALTGAVSLERSLSTVVPYPRFLLGGIALLWLLNGRMARERLHVAVVALLSIWSIDAMWQYLSGHNILGYPYNGERLNGFFYPDFRLGPELAVFLPVYLR